jgi:hypothetical protein
VRQWLFLLGGLLVWTAHFFGVYTAASLFPGSPIARWLTVAITAAALAVAGWLLVLSWRGLDGSQTASFERWKSGIAALGSALAIVAILFQGLPALFNR